MTCSLELHAFPQKRQLRFLIIVSIIAIRPFASKLSHFRKDIELSPSGLPRPGSPQKLKDFAFPPEMQSSRVVPFLRSRQAARCRIPQPTITAAREDVFAKAVRQLLQAWSGSRR